MFSEKMLAPCGLDCSLCSQAHRKEKPCPGCMSEGAGKSDFCENRCTIIRCEKRLSNGWRFCDVCPEWPCAAAAERESRYASVYVLTESPAENLRLRRQLGTQAFLARHKEKWQCPVCGGVIVVHDGRCTGCGAQYGPALKDKKE